PEEGGEMATMPAASATNVPASASSDLAGVAIVTPWPGQSRAGPGPAAPTSGRRRRAPDATIVGVTLYRDPLAGLRSQIATKQGLLESRERALPPLLRAMLPERLR